MTESSPTVSDLPPIARQWAVPVWLLKLGVFSVCLLPLLNVLWLAYQDRLSANPIDDITDQTGLWTLRLLLITLLMTPLRRIFGWSWPQRVRRMLGLFAFFYASLHLLTYLWLDQFFWWEDIIADIIKRPFITLGVLAFLCLLPLAATSTTAMMKRLGRNWKRLHRLAYVVPTLGVLHFVWLVKADYREPLLYGSLLALLLGLRLHWARRT